MPELVESIPIDRILQNPYQVRRGVEEEDLHRLVQSMASMGLLSPIKVRPHPTKPDYYELVYGERRFRAGQILEWKTIPAIIEEVSDQEVAIQSLVENLERSDLNPLEEAQGYRLLRTHFGYSVTQIATIFGKSRPYISNMLRLLNLDPFLQACVLCKTLHPWHARIINVLPIGFEKFRLADLAMDWSLTLQETRNIVNAIRDGEILFSWERSIAIDGVKIHPSDDFNPDVVRHETLEFLSSEGQQEPIDVSVTGVLVDGFETFLAAKQLGWKTIIANLWFFTEWLQSDPEEDIEEACTDEKLNHGIIPEPTEEQKARIDCLIKHLAGQEYKYPILVSI